MCLCACGREEDQEEAEKDWESQFESRSEEPNQNSRGLIPLWKPTKSDRHHLSASLSQTHTPKEDPASQPAQPAHPLENPEHSFTGVSYSHISPPQSAMTESVSGSSLLQARGDTHSTSHEHSHHHHIRSHHKRLHQHQQSHQHLEKKEAHPADDSSVVHIVQTVDVVQIIDGSGATISLSTVAPPPPPTKSAPPNVLQALPDHKVAVAATTDDAAADSLHTPIPTTPTPSPELDISASLSMSPSFPTVESYAKISSTPLPSGSSSGAFPSFSGVTNVTTTPTTQRECIPIISSLKLVARPHISNSPQLLFLQRCRRHHQSLAMAPSL